MRFQRIGETRFQRIGEGIGRSQRIGQGDRIPADWGGSWDSSGLGREGRSQRIGEEDGRFQRIGNSSRFGREIGDSSGLGRERFKRVREGGGIRHIGGFIDHSRVTQL